jgi:tRNA(fMet)-specific endonuclease VapC
MRYVLDTNTLIYFFKRMGNVANHLLQHPPQEIGIPTIVLYEIEVGLAKSHAPDKRRQQLALLLTTVALLPFGAAEARQAALIRADLEQQGLPIGSYDVLIAATAMAHGATLVTRNQQEFGRIAGLKLADWYT